MPDSAPAGVQDEGSRQGNFEAQSHSVWSRCLRFAVEVTRHHARLASGCWPGSAGRGWLPAGFRWKVSHFEMILLSRASWRKVRPSFKLTWNSVWPHRLAEQNVPLEDVQHLAGHADPRTTRLYDRRRRKVTRNIVERISIWPTSSRPWD